jgi:hypothetical protein
MINKEYVNNIRTYWSPAQQDKPLYNIDNAFTPALFDFFCELNKVGFQGIEIVFLSVDIKTTCNFFEW